jgi:hypothetical protein
VLCLIIAEKQQNNMQCPDGAKITNAITEFVMQEEGGDVETLRKALYCQVKSIYYILFSHVTFKISLKISSVVSGLLYADRHNKYDEVNGQSFSFLFWERTRNGFMLMTIGLRSECW